MTAGVRARRRLVMVAPNWLGDAVMSLPAVARAAAHPDWELTVVAAPYTARVYWGLDGVHEVQAAQHGEAAGDTVDASVLGGVFDVDEAGHGCFPFRGSSLVAWEEY